MGHGAPDSPEALAPWKILIPQIDYGSIQLSLAHRWTTPMDEIDAEIRTDLHQLVDRHLSSPSKHRGRFGVQPFSQLVHGPDCLSDAPTGCNIEHAPRWIEGARDEFVVVSTRQLHRTAFAGCGKDAERILERN